MFRPVVITPIVCALAAGAATVSFARGSWLGVVWLLLAGLTSNMALSYARRARSAARAGAAGAAGACAGGGAAGGACGTCVKKVCA
ncbi:hypothetical protein ABT301_21525 [Streptomyces sp. NPDC000987]|uniref:hypothetical protein n=1 Tax=Streptomyces sp. NPDC000987 TaxID=3154374 RepID=UPI00331A4F6F